MLLCPGDDEFLAFYIASPLPYQSDCDDDTLVLEIVDIHLVLVPDIGLEVATIFLGHGGTYSIELSSQSSHEFGE